MDTEEICKLIILGIVLFGIYHFFIRKSPRDERKDVERKELELPTPPTPPPSPPPIPQVKPSTDERKLKYILFMPNGVDILERRSQISRN